jgi:IMP cyclohydrolase
MQIEVPTKILSSDEIKALSPVERDSYIQSVILEILKMNPSGVTIYQISSKIPFSRPTIAKHFDVLVAIGEAYRVQRGNLSVYYKNGKIVHETDVKSTVIDDKIYTFYKLENAEGKFLYIQEKELDEFRSPRVKGGVMVNEKDIQSFFQQLGDFVKRGNNNWLMT